jgi:hypothetical protein
LNGELTNGAIVGDGDGEAVGVGVGEGVADGDGEGVADVEAVGLGSATPLFQTNFFPDLTQVNLFPFAVAVLPIFLQGSPALTAATALNGAASKAIAIRATSGRFTFKW